MSARVFVFSKTTLVVLVLFLLMLCASRVWADGSSIGKVYDPYVQLLENDFEYRTLYSEQDDSSALSGLWEHRLGYGQSLTDRLSAEGYMIALDGAGNTLSLDGFELEMKYQLTEQGEYSNDWGVMVELEREKNQKSWEARTALIMLHEWTDWIATGNLSVIYEWKDDTYNEWETAFAGQLRYRYSEALEPAIELYKAQYTSAIGPVLTGLWRLGSGRKLNWEAGTIFGLDDKTPEVNYKLTLEYEF